MVHTGREVFMIPKQAYKQLVLSMLALMIAMSISRFAYTPILPFMQQDLLDE